MAYLCSVVVIIGLIQGSCTTYTGERYKELSLAKSLGLFPGKHSANLKNDSLSDELLQQYQELMKSSRESLEKFDAHEENTLRGLVGDHDLEAFSEGAALNRRRRGGAHQPSAFSRRRSRSQAFRRQRLNTQSRRSHVFYSKATDSDEMF